MDEMIILGGGLAGVSLASFYNGRSIVLEKEAQPGGLCRSFFLNGIAYDVGPHVIFSKNKEVLDLHCRLIETQRIRRMNNVLFRGRWVKYPFENDLAALDPADNHYCLHEFLHNPHEHVEARNMLQFFLKTFGEGITRLYLAPYNEKIWKFDPSLMDTQMVERIPKPPREDVIKSSQGIPTEGYTHQLHFHYPREGGIQSLFDAYRRRAAERSRLVHPVAIERVHQVDGLWHVATDRGTFRAPRLVNCMPLHELFKVLDAPDAIGRTVHERLLYNSIHIVMVQVRRDCIGDRFAIYVPDKDVVFHRVSRLNFLGDVYTLPDDGSTLLAEVTFFPGTPLSRESPESIRDRVVADLARVGLIVGAEDVLATEVRTFKYAYVIYDLDHRRNTDTVLGYLRSRGIACVGRFAEFEYLNTDGVVERVLKLARTLDPSAAPADEGTPVPSAS